MTFSKRRAPNYLIVGYTTRDHLLIDLDDISDIKARGIAKIIMHEFHEVGDCLILRSSTTKEDHYWSYSRFGRPLFWVKRNNYHIVFDNVIGYNKCCKICAFLAELNVLEKSYIYCRNFRGDMTLRVSPATMSWGVKEAPKPIECLTNIYTAKKDGKIDEFLRFRRAALSLFDGDGGADASANDAADGSDHDAEVLTINSAVQANTLDRCDADDAN